MLPTFRWLVVVGVVAFGLLLTSLRWFQPRATSGRDDDNGASALRIDAASGADRDEGVAQAPTARAPFQIWTRPAAMPGPGRLAGSPGGVWRGVGRTVEVEARSLARLAGAEEGADLLMPVFDGATLIGQVQRRQTEASGLALVGGELTGARRGTFAFSRGASGLHGFLLIPGERLAIVVESVRAASGSQLRLVEKPISEVLCSPYPTMEPGTFESAEKAGEEDGAGGTSTEPIPLLSSRPAATAVLYIDFDGEIVSDPNWNGGQTIQAKAASLSAEEIVEIWQRVSEDYVGFDVDVTTDVRRYSAATVGRRMRCIVTPTDIAARGAGGVAYLNSFSEAGKTFSSTIPCWVFNPGVVGAAEAISHEFGHTLGLRHDGRTSPSEEYFQGHGDGALSWAPIMGVGYYKNVVQWSKGEYAAANNQEDDIAVIASTVNGFGFSGDEAGDTMETAMGFVGGTLGEVGIEGVIQSAADTDLFRFDAPAGVVRLVATPAEVSPNLDVRLELRDAAGQVLATANPDLDLEAEIQFTLPATGSYYLAVAGVGHGDPLSDGYSKYGSAGAYTISGEIPVGDGRPVFPTDVTVTTARTIAFTYQIRAGNAPTAYEVSGLPAGLTVNAETGVISGIPTAAEGSYTVTVTATNALGSGTGSFVITLSAQPVPTLSGSAMSLARLNRPMELQVQATALPHAYAATGLPSGLTIDPATGLIAGTPAAAGVFSVTVSATNSAGTGEMEFSLVVVDTVQRIAAGDSHSLMVRGDGTLWGTGWNFSGELGDGTTSTRSTPIKVASDVLSAATGTQHSVYLKSDGTVWGMGHNGYGQLGDGTQISRKLPVQVATGATAVAVGYYHSLFLKADGTLWGMGANENGQLGDGTRTRRLIPIQIASEVVAMAAGGNQSFWIKADGSLWATGDNESGELGDGTRNDQSVPVRVAEDVFSVSAAGSHTLFVKTDGSLWGMGYNGQHQLGGGNPISCVLPVKMGEGVVAGSAASSTTLYRTVDSKLWLLGQWQQAIHSTPLQVGASVVSFSGRTDYLIYASADGKFWGAGSNRNRVLGDGSPARRDIPVMIARDVAMISAGGSHSLFVKSDGSLWGAGYNTLGQLGDGSRINRGVPVPIATDVVKVAGGSSHSLFLKTGGELWGMGVQTDGQFYTIPTRIAQQVTAATAGSGFSLWIKSDGTLWSEGRNNLGQLGDGTTTERRKEILVTSDVEAVFAGGAHALFQKTDGALWGTGNNTSGQLGDGTNTSRSTPLPIAEDVAKAAASYYHSLFIKQDGTLWGTGNNSYGELGDGTTNPRNSPLQIASRVVDAAATDFGTYYVTEEGYLWAIGRGFAKTATRIARGVMSVASGGAHALFLRKDRSLWALGDNEIGQLGDGTVLFYDSPVEIEFGRPAVEAVTLPFEANPGEAVVFSVTAIGEGPLSYQWRRDGVAIEGATGSSFSLNNVQGADGGVYDVVVTNAVGSVVSAAGSLTILGAPPKIVSASTWSAARFGSVAFRIEATNEPTSFSASGLPEGLALDAEDGSITGTPTASAGVYTVTVGAANAHGSATGSLTITLSGANAPTISNSRTAVARRGAAFRMQITASGSPQSYGATGLPAGLSVDAATGLISGAPTAQPGIYSSNLTATNEGGTAAMSVKFAVLPEAKDRAAGYQSTFFIDDDGTLWSAGENDFGQLGDGTTMHRSVPVPIAEDVVSVATSTTDALFIKTDGTLWGVGWNAGGMLGFGDTQERSTPALIRNDVIGVAAGLGHSVFLKSDGTAWTVGRNNSGQLGDGTTQNRLQPVMIASEVVSVGAAGESTYLVKSDGTFWATGSNYDGELGDGTFENRSSPVLVASDVSAVQGSLSLTLFLKKDATLWGMGFNGGDQLRMLDDGDDYKEPTPVKLADDVASFSAGANQVLYVTTSAELWGRGLNWWGQLGDRTKLYETGPRQIAADVAFAFTGYNHSVFRKTDGGMWALGTSSAGELADGFDALQTIPVKVADNIVRSAAGDGHSLFLTNRGELWGVGYNALGSLGDGSNVDRGEPVKIAEGVADVATSFWHSVFVKQDGSLWAMGNNGDGQLGTGGLDSSGINRPRRVMDNVKSAVTGVWHTVVLRKDGTVWTIGWNGQGQLGDGTNVQRTTPVQVMSGVIEVAAGAKHTLFLKVDGTLWATGDNEAGQLGDGTTTSRNAPVQVMTDVARIAAGGWHSLFLKADGTLWGMGYNQLGQLGDGSSTDRPTPILMDSNVRSMAPGIYHTQYIKEDGTLWVTGRNDFGQLGDGVAAQGIERENGVGAPAAGGDGSLAPRVVKIEADQATGIALTSSGERPRLPPAITAQAPAEKGRHAMVGLAAGAYLQTEQPQTQYRPVRVATGVSHVAAGGYHSLYRKHNGSLWAMGQAMYGRLGNGAGLVQWEPKEIEFGPPAIQSQSIPYAVRLGQVVELSVEAAGIGPFTYQWRKDGQAIPSATSSRWLLSGVTAPEGGVYDVVVSNALGSRACTAVNVSVVDAAPVIRSSLAVEVPRLSDDFEYHLQANNDATSFAAEGLPLGLSLDATTGLISGRIESEIGAVPVTLTATNVNGSTTATLTITVTGQAPPAITSATTLLARQGQRVNYTIAASNTPTGFSADDLPAGLTVNPATGVISGTVSAAPGDYVATVTASNASGAGSAELQVIVLPIWKGIAAGDGHSLVVDADGTLWSMGANQYGQLGSPSRIARSSPRPFAENVVAVNAVSGVSVFLKADGTLWFVGYLPIFETNSTQVEPVQIASRVRDMAVGTSHLVFIDWDGVLWSRGQNRSGQMGDGTTVARTTAIEIAEDVTSVAAGWDFSVFVKRDGSLWAAGRNAYGQLGDGTTTDRHTFVRVAEGVRSVAAGESHTLIVKADGSLWTAGSNFMGLLGDGTNVSRSTPVHIHDGVVHAWGNHGSLFLTQTGELWAMGDNGVAGWTGWTPKKVASQMVGAASGRTHVLLIDSSGRVSVAGDNSYGQLGESSMAVSHFGKVANDAVRVSGARDHTLFAKHDGTLWGMGDPYSGQRGGYGGSLDVQAVPGIDGVKEVAAGSYYTLFLRVDGTLWGMGNNADGQIGGSESSIRAPVQVAADVASVTTGGDATLFVKTMGEMWGTGYNYNGILGDGSRTNRATPVKILEGVRSTASGWAHSLILKSDGSLWGAGQNYWGQLGNAPVDSSTPVRLATDVVTMAAGANHTLYVTRDNVLWAMGGNASGQLGDGTIQDRLTPIPVASGVVAVSASGESSFFLKTDGSLWASGSNTYGELGDGTRQNRLSPILVATGVQTVSAAPEATFIIKNDRSLWSTGSNYRGRLGVSIVASRSEPKEIVLGVPEIDLLSIPPAANKGGTAQFEVIARDVGESTYQWRRNGAPIPGATSGGYFIPVVAAADGGVYDVVVTGLRGSVVSSAVTFTVLNAPPVITSSLSATAQSGQAFEYRVEANNDAYVFGASGLPAGLVIDGTTGRISGVVNALPGTYPVSLTAGNAHGTVHAVLQLEISEVAPAFTTQPSGQTVTTGGNASFTVAASGVPAPTMQWQVSSDGSTWSDVANGGVYGGATTNTFSLTGATLAMNGYRYRAVATNTAGTATSDAATLTVNGIAPSITTQPSGQTVTMGGNAGFTVAANGAPSPTLRWQVSTNNGSTWSEVANGSVYGGATTETLNIIGTTLAMNGYRYRAVATNTAGTATSNAATLTVNGIVPSIATQPSGQMVTIGGNSSFAVAANGAPAPTLQWQVSTDGSTWSDVANAGVYSGATTNTLSITGATLSMNGYRYRAVATNSAGTATSNAATLTVNGIAPSITRQPSGQTVTAGGSASFTVAANGAPPPTLQWQVSIDGSTWSDIWDGGLYDGTITSTLSVSDVVLSMNGYRYRAVATNAIEVATSDAATLIVNGIAPSFTTQPLGQTVNAGDSVSFGVAVSGTPEPTLKWEVSPDGSTWTDVPNSSPYLGPTGWTLGITNATASLNGYLYRVVAANAYGSATSDAVMLTVKPLPTHAGIYFGEFMNNRGHWAMEVNADGSGVYIAYLSARKSAIHVQFTVAPDGTFSVWSGEIVPAVRPIVRALSNGGTSKKTSALTGDFRLSGRIAAGVVTGELSGFGETFSGLVEGGPGTAPVGFHSATNSSNSSAIYAVVAPSGRVLVVTVASTAIDAANGQLSADGSLSASTASGGQLTAVIGEEQVVASLTPPGSSTPITFGPTGTATHAVEPGGYTAGGTVSVTNTFAYTGAPTGLTWQLLLPEGWSFVSSTATLTASAPAVGTTGTLEWTWTTPPPSPVTFTYVLSVPANSTGAKEIAAIAGLQSAGTTVQLLVKPDPLIVNERASYHSADTNSDWKLGLLELARVIELYNTRSGGSRSGAYAVLDGSEDGFAPEPARAINASAALARYHSADTDRNGRLSLLELARVIELYNQRTSGVRAGRYKVQSGSEDGYAVEP